MGVGVAEKTALDGKRVMVVSPLDGVAPFVVQTAERCDQIAWYMERGFTHRVFHMPGHDQKHALRVLAPDVLSRLPARFAHVSISERVAG